MAADILLFLPQFFQKAALNVRDNVGEEVDPEQLIQETCRSCLEQVGTSTHESVLKLFLGQGWGQIYPNL